jgi:hypothetical protein
VNVRHGKAPVAGQAGPAARAFAISPDDGSVIDLRVPAVAALLSWLVPGLGQLYQGRRLKGLLFMGSLLAVLVAGMVLGGGRVAYWLWTPGERRLAFVGQAGIGLVALPAVLQASRLAGPAHDTYFGSGLFAPPLRPGQLVSAPCAARVARADPGMTFDPVAGTSLARCRSDQLSAWHRRLGRFFDIGTLYTVLAGMLNILVVYDAFSGPLREPREDRDGEADGVTGGGDRGRGHGP